MKLLDLPLIVEEYDFKRKGENIHKINQYLIGMTESNLVKIQKSEITEYKWATYEEALETSLQKALSLLKDK